MQNNIGRPTVEAVASSPKTASETGNSLPLLCRYQEILDQAHVFRLGILAKVQRLLREEHQINSQD